jgi:ABC-type branched-subunit amino acid transport system ATPase component/ABC-type branched-subunit amino acid transport system permease subunit
MKEYLLYAFYGFGAGAVIGMLGLGIVVAYRGSGVINFAHGAIAMWAAYVYTELRDTGDYVFPVVGIPGRVHLGEPLGLTAALVIGVVSAALLGLVLHLLIFRPLRDAPALAKVVASVGVLIVLQALVLLRFEDVNRIVPPILPREAWNLPGDFPVQSDRMYFAGVLVLVALVLAVTYRFTRFGLATRAAAESEKGATLLGYSADFLAGANWVVAGTVAGIGGILVAPITGVNPLNYTLFIVPAIGAALVGRFSSFLVTAAAGLGIGIVQAEFLQLQGDFPDFFRNYGIGLREAVPFAVIAIVIFFLGAGLPTRGALHAGRLPFSPRPRPSLVSVGVPFAITAGALLVLGSGYRLALVNSLIGAVVCLSLVVLTGWVGQISLAQMSMAGVAGFALSRFTHDWGIPFPIAPVLAAFLAALFGVFFGIPALRVRGVNLAIVTLALAVACQEFLFKNPKYTGALLEGAPVPNPQLFGIDLGLETPGELYRWQFGMLALVVLTLLALGAANVRRGVTGRRMLAVRSNERAAATAGINVAATKLIAFGASAFIAGMAGALLAYQRGNLNDTQFGVFFSLAYLAFAYLGGISSVSGALVGGSLVGGGIFFYTVRQVFGGGDSFSDLELLIGGLGLIVAAVLNPEGIAGAIRQAVASARRRPALQAGVPRAEVPRPTAAGSITAPGAAATGDAATGTAATVEGAAERPLLETDGLSVSYGGVRAVDDVSLRVPVGHVVGLIGPNGAGKTTFVDAVTGLVPSHGRVELAGARIDELAAHQRARLGLARTYQSVELFDDLTVRENLVVAAERPTWWAMAADVVRPGRHATQAGVEWALALLELDALADAYPQALSQGQRKIVGVARALAVEPRLVLLDEPAAGLDTRESAELGVRIRHLVDHGVSVLLVDHDMGLVLSVCDTVYVLDFGQVIGQGTPAEIRADERVVAAYLGERAERQAAATTDRGATR